MKILGIDLGTTNSAAALWDRGREEMIPNAEATDARNTIPSMVHLRPQNNEPVVGSAAKAYGMSSPQYTFTGLKRLVGRQFDDPYVQSIVNSVPYEIVEGPNGAAWVAGPDRTYSPEELLALILARLKRFAQVQHQEQISPAVLAVPAYFDELQKAGVRRAASLAGFELLRTISEPTAAALAYGLHRAGDRTILVYDFGGGTFDVSILKVRGSRFTTLAQAGDTTLGGTNFDMAVAAHLASLFEARHGVDPRTDIYALYRLVSAAEDIKKQLSTHKEMSHRIDRVIKIPNSFEVPSFEITMTQAGLEALVGDLVEQSFETVQRALDDAKLTAKQIDQVVLIGGQTRMPLIQKRVTEFFGRPPLRDINPEEAVAIGAAAFAATIQGDLSDISLNEIATHTIGIEAADGSIIPIIKRKDSLAKRKIKTIPLSEANQTSAAIRVFQGERPQASDNRWLATLVLEGIASGGVEVGIDYDANGILQIDASDADGDARVAAGVHLTTGFNEEEARTLREIV
jgi:molecular chaperone DnaK